MFSMSINNVKVIFPNDEIKGDERRVRTAILRKNGPVLFTGDGLIPNQEEVTQELKDKSKEVVCLDHDDRVKRVERNHVVVASPDMQGVYRALLVIKGTDQIRMHPGDAEYDWSRRLMQTITGQSVKSRQGRKKGYAEMLLRALLTAHRSMDPIMSKVIEREAQIDLAKCMVRQGELLSRSVLAVKVTLGKEYDQPTLMGEVTRVHKSVKILVIRLKDPEDHRRNKVSARVLQGCRREYNFFDFLERSDLRVLDEVYSHNVVCTEALWEENIFPRLTGHYPDLN